MKRWMRLAVSSACSVSLVATSGAPAFASSHREAPLITTMPKVDGTDLYAFMSYEAGRDGYVTLIANYNPLQDAYGGPNFFTMDKDAKYNIKVDNDGDAIEDITFQWRFDNTLKGIALPIGNQQVPIPIVQIGAISASNSSQQNVLESYTVDVVRTSVRRGKTRSTTAAVTNAATGSNRFAKPIDNIGNKTIADYATYASNFVYNVNIPGCAIPGKLFTGQRKEGFVVNLGETFDLINDNPVGPRNGRPNIIDDKNVTSLILEVHKSCLTSASQPVIGVWTTSELPESRTIQKDARRSFSASTKSSKKYTQVSRLGMPLVNELIIGLPAKDKFNGSFPKDDAQFATFFERPTLAAIIEILFGSLGVKAPTRFPRTDFKAVFYTGLPGLNQLGTIGEMLRLNTSIPSVAAAQQNNLGVLGGDTAGFPNGRRPGDDVVDIELRVEMGVLLPASDAQSGQLPYTDGALVSGTDFPSTFPYLKTPIPGSPAS